jgi:exodeoxyribonuclease-3
MGAKFDYGSRLVWSSQTQNPNMQIVSFNINGLRAAETKDKSGKKECDPETNVLRSLIREQAADILCLQEVKTSNIDDFKSYRDLMPYIYLNHSKDKKGYSGVAILSKVEPISVTSDFDRIPKVAEVAATETFMSEGRILTAEYEKCYVVSVYTVNAKDGLARLDERLKWDRLFRQYINILQGTKPVIVCGDLNCAHNDIDIHNPKGHKKSPGFSDEERASFSLLLQRCALRDTYRALHPTDVKYTYWSNYNGARTRNVGWRIDYILVGGGVKINSADCLNDYFGSDHCPIISSVSF